MSPPTDTREMLPCWRRHGPLAVAILTGDLTATTYTPNLEHATTCFTSGGGGGGISSLAASTHGPVGADGGPASACSSTVPALAFSWARERGVKNASSLRMSGAAVLSTADESPALAPSAPSPHDCRLFWLVGFMVFGCFGLPKRPVSEIHERGRGLVLRYKETT